MKKLKAELDEVMFIREIYTEKSRSGKPFHGVVLANGRTEKMFPVVGIDREDLKDLSEEQVVTVTFEIDRKSVV